MKLRLFVIFLLFISLFLELNILSFPLNFLFTYIIFATESKPPYMIAASVLSMAGDSVLGLPMGATVLSVLLVNFAVLLYARFLGSKDALVYSLLGITGMLIYAIIFGYSVSSLFNWSMLFVIVWIIYRLIPKRFLQI